jgi:hypothetical protein
VQNEGRTKFDPPPTYKLPYRVLLPKVATQCTNLVVTFCMSASHVALVINAVKLAKV